MSAGWIALFVLLVVALAAIAVLRRRGRPRVEAGPKAPGKPQADPALSPLVETQGAPAADGRLHDPIGDELGERERRNAARR